MLNGNDSKGIPTNQFDRVMGQLDGLPDTARTKPTTIISTATLLGHTQTFIVQTVRQREEGDTIFLQAIEDGGATPMALRLVIPPAVSDAIARQRDAITTIVRKRSAKRVANERKAAGIEPGFMKNRGTGKRSGKKRGGR